MARELDALTALVNANGGTDPARVQATNRALMDVERAFLLEGGLPRRPWFRHAFYAPGVYTGYSAVIFPGVREAASGRDWDAAARQLGQVRNAIDRGTNVLTRARGALGRLADPPDD